MRTNQRQKSDAKKKPISRLTRLPALVFLLGLFLFATGADARIRIVFDGRQVELEELTDQDRWNELEPNRRLSLVPYLIDLHFSERDPEALQSLADRLARENDELLQAYGKLALVYKRVDDRAGRIGVLQHLLDKSAAKHPRQLYLYHLALEKNAREGKRVDRNTGLACKIPGMEDACRLVNRSEKIYRYTRDASLSEKDYHNIVEEIRPYITGGPRLAPFPYLIAWPLPDSLVSLGLPMEAAVIAERITHSSRAPAALELRSRVPFYLGAAGDFPGAIDYSERYHIEDDPILLNIRMDWMIMAERYKDAVDMLSDVGAEKLGGRRMQGMTDYWTDLPYSPSIVGIKLAMLFHLGGDTASAGKTLDRLTGINDRTPDGEPLSQYVRLRMAQIFIEENPDLAHKIAEDVSYIAQAKGWTELEYQATVLDGWARYYQKEYYRSVVNFVKASGIARYLKDKNISPYSRLLGLLAARRKMRPRSAYASLVKQVHRILEEEPYSRSVYFLRHFAPLSADEDFFVERIVEGKNARRRYWSAFNDLIQYYRKKKLLYFAPGKNPGGLEGLATSSFWLSQMKRLPYINSGDRGITMPGLTRGASARTRAVRSSTLGDQVSRDTFRDTEYYLFAFPSGENERIVYLIYPRKNKRGRYYSVLTYARWDKEDVRGLLESCPAGSDEDCSGRAPRLNRFRKILAARKNAYLNVLYTPEFDIDYRSLLDTSRKRDIHTVHFVNPRHMGDPERKRAPEAYTPAGCPLDDGFPEITRDRFFYRRFTGPEPAPGVWLLGEAREPQDEGNPFLSRFPCSNRSISFLDMVRFDRGRAPDALVYRADRRETDFDRSFVHYFTGRGSIVVQAFDDTETEALEQFQTILNENVEYGLTTAFIRAAYLTKKRHGEQAPRVILPGFPDS